MTDLISQKEPQSKLHFEYELYEQGCTLVAGIDEAGAGAWAGPVVAAAVLFKPGQVVPAADDSKKLSAKKREQLADIIKATAECFAIGMATVDEIDLKNIYQAGLLAMHRAVDGLAMPPQHLLVDARPLHIGIPFTSLIKGDARCHAIACASIIAKTSRDELLRGYAEKYPQYGFELHKGYGTAKHQQALAAWGPCAIHRKSYKPIKSLLRKQTELF